MLNTGYIEKRCKTNLYRIKKIPYPLLYLNEILYSFCTVWIPTIISKTANNLISIISTVQKASTARLNENKYVDLTKIVN